jgi:hypothetical protein
MGRDRLALAAAVGDLEARAGRVHRAADQLATDAAQFGTWLGDPDRRREELAADADAVDRFVDDLAADLDGIDDAGDPATAWFDAALRSRAAGLLLADLRAELDDLQDWPDADPDSTDEIARRLDALARRRSAVGEAVESAARPAWRERAGDRLEAAAADLDSHDPPVDWAAVRETLAAHRPDA